MPPDAGQSGNATSTMDDREPLGEVWERSGVRWRCRIETKINWRGKQVYRWVLERKFVSWRDWQSGAWTQSESKAWASGRAHLAARAHDRYEEVGRV